MDTSTTARQVTSVKSLLSAAQLEAAESKDFTLVTCRAVVLVSLG